MKYVKIYILSLFICINIFIFYAVFHENRNGLLKIAFLNIGQGDAIFIESPTGTQILVDSGPNKIILSALGRVMPFYDRSLDAIIATHPDADHVGGFPSVLRNYTVGEYFYNGAVGTTGVFHELEDQVQKQLIKTHIARRGETIDIGGGAYLSILYPDRKPQGKDTNEYSIIAQLVYGDSTILLTGDAPRDVEEYLANIDSDRLQSDILKVAHHGSKNSLSSHFFSTVHPTYSVISAGLNNRYGHPHKQILDSLEKIKTIVLQTMDLGDIIFTSDGKNIQKIKS